MISETVEVIEADANKKDLQKANSFSGMDPVRGVLRLRITPGYGIFKLYPRRIKMYEFPPVEPPNVQVTSTMPKVTTQAFGLIGFVDDLRQDHAPEHQDVRLDERLDVS